MSMTMTLLNSSLSSTFLTQYKQLLGAIADKPMKTSDDFNEARNVLFKEGLNKSYVFDSSYEESFVCAVRGAIYGMFIYAKKYKNGYALKASNNVWLCIKALTTPLEEMIPDWVLIDTAVLPYCGFLVCDGLVVNRHAYIGPNMIKSMTQELKTERKKWPSKNIPPDHLRSR
jgi:hypothetical protein